ncbi:MAG: PrgI family protein [Candidatus Andersenbacteria bacterium]
MRFQVPQFVDIEDKIIGPFTLKQFLIYLSGVLGLIPLYLIFDLSLFITVAIPIMGIAVLFAHLRFHGKSLFAVIANALRFFLRGQVFVWQRTDQPKLLRIAGEEYGDFSPDAMLTIPEDSVSSLSRRARALETEGKLIKEDAPDPLADEAEE